MAYVLRNEAGNVIAISTDESLSGDWELVSNNDLQYISFLEHAIQKVSAFRESDIKLSRVLEDLIEILMKKNLILFTDFPIAAQKRLIQRKSMRQSQNNLSALIVDD